MSTKVVLNREACMGHGQCYAQGPGVFEPDDMGHCIVTHSVVGEDLREEAIAGVEACPERALTVEDS